MTELLTFATGAAFGAFSVVVPLAYSVLKRAQKAPR